jgi:hypothetical protein
METMTGRERIMTALRNGQPDRVPATPDISIMVPTRLTGKPSWEVEYNHNPSLQCAYFNAIKYFDLDGWLYNGRLQFRQKSEIHRRSEVISRDPDKWVVVTVISTHDGDLTSKSVYYRDNPWAFLEKPSSRSKRISRSSGTYFRRSSRATPLPIGSKRRKWVRWG